MEISLHSLLSRAAHTSPQVTATVYRDRRQTWSTLEQRVARLAAALQALGLQEADRIAILSLNSDLYLESLFAISWAGFTAVPLNTRWALAENEYALRDSGSRVVLFDEHFAGQVETLRESVEGLDHCVFMGDAGGPGWAPTLSSLIEDYSHVAASRRSGDDLLGIFYTGGTTGFPKGVMQSHRALWASAIGALPAFDINRDSIYLHAAPMFHIADFAGTMSALLTQATSVVLTSFDPQAVLQIIAEQRVTHVLLVPTMIKMVLSHPQAGTADLSSLQKLLYGASPMPAEILKQCMQLWPHVGLAQAYGQTELAPIATTLTARDHLDGGDRLRSAGRPTPVTEIRIIDSAGEDCAIGKTGEIAVRGMHTMLGYWNKPEQTAQTLRDGWVHTGDAGYLNEAGYLFIADRVKDMIITGGENVYTTEVENAVISHAAVRDVAVIGIPDAEWGEAVHAIVILNPDHEVTETELIGHCHDRIAGFKCPKSITFRTEPLPVSGAGKVLKTELRKPFWEGRDKVIY